MPPLRTFRAVTVGLVLALIGLGPVAGATAPPQTDPVSAAQLGQQAYDYGLPLLEFLRVRREMTSVPCPDSLGNSPVNTFSNLKAFADPSARTVVAPNTDTLYSIAHLDLSRGPIVLRHPAMGTRYYSFAMLDPFTNVLATPGTREDGSAAAAIVVRWAGHLGTAPVPRGARVVESPYRRLWVIGRTLAGDQADQQRAYHLMQQYSLSQTDGSRPTFRATCLPGHPSTYPVPTDGPGFVAALNAGLAENPPPAQDAPLLSALRPYGIGAGLSPDTAGLDPTTKAALYQGVSTEATALPLGAKVTPLVTAAQHHGWYLPPSNIGAYGTDYKYRAQIALLGLGANTPAEAIYPAGLADTNGLPYYGANNYRLTFTKDQEPPARFFWSLTMYDFSGYLVANEAHRYSVGPSHPRFLRQADGSIVIAVQHTAPTDPSVNWLPAPTGQFRLNLRLYGPSQDAIKGVWSPPGVQNLGPSH